SSVVVVTSEELENTPSVQNAEDALEDIPNIVTFGSSNEGPFIRGQATTGPLQGGANFFTGSLPRATMTLDGRPISFNEYVFGTTSVWDVETIEVFRGPQTTSQGVNAIAGAIHIRTKDPVFQAEMAGRAQVSSFNGRQFSLMANSPIVNNQLAVRGTLDFRRRDTYISYNTPGQDVQPEAEELQQFTGRLKVLWEPAAVAGLSMKLTYVKTDTTSPQTENIDRPFSDLARTDNDNPSVFQTKSNVWIQDTKYRVSDQVSLSNQFVHSDYTIDRFLSNTTDGLLLSNGKDLVNETLVNLNLMGGKLTGVAGVNVRRVKEDFTFLTNFGGLLLTTVFDDQKKSFGAFTELTYKVTNRLDVTGGIRYQRDDQRRQGVAFESPFLPGDRELDFDETFDQWLPKFAIGYNITDELRVGGVISKGYNPGGSGISFGTVQAFLPVNPFYEFKEETLWNYELFMRGNFLNNRLGLQANAFYTDFKDAQRNSTTLVNGLPDTIIRNAESAESYGLEISANYQVSDQLRINGSAGFLKTEFKEFTTSTASLEGNEFRSAPAFTGTIGFDYEIIKDLTFGAKVRYNDGYYSDDENRKTTEVDAFTVVDLKLNYEPHKNVKLFAFVNNVFDDIHPVFLFEPTANGQTGQVGVPREFGIGGSIKFN
ncbi:MAG: TonB-dependent receptor, partial [Pseudomonadota bacterium]